MGLQSGRLQSEGYQIRIWGSTHLSGSYSLAGYSLAGYSLRGYNLVGYSLVFVWGATVWGATLSLGGCQIWICLSITCSYNNIEEELLFNIGP